MQHKKINPLKNQGFLRGDNQIWTGDQGVADPCLTAWLRRHIDIDIKNGSHLLSQAVSS